MMAIIPRTATNFLVLALIVLGGAVVSAALSDIWHVPQPCVPSAPLQLPPAVATIPLEKRSPMTLICPKGQHVLQVQTDGFGRLYWITCVQDGKQDSAKLPPGVTHYQWLKWWKHDPPPHSSSGPRSRAWKTDNAMPLYDGTETLLAEEELDREIEKFNGTTGKWPARISDALKPQRPTYPAGLWWWPTGVERAPFVFAEKPPDVNDPCSVSAALKAEAERMGKLIPPTADAARYVQQQVTAYREEGERLAKECAAGAIGSGDVVNALGWPLLSEPCRKAGVLRATFETVLYPADGSGPITVVDVERRTAMLAEYNRLAMECEGFL
jgi:hypothetical protein